MPIYNVKSGEMNERIETPYPAIPAAIFFMALGKTLNLPMSFGRLVEISGGQYAGDNVTYCSTQRLLEEAGFMAKEDANAQG